jgi:hypothetical protein
MPAPKRPAVGDTDSCRMAPPVPTWAPAPAGDVSSHLSTEVSHGAAPPGPSAPQDSVVPLAAAPASPGRNRQLFLASVTPQAMTCDLRSALVGLGIKHNLVGIVIAIFPTQKGPPARRHIFIMDSCGVTGVTVWNGDVQKFPKDVLGSVITITRASVSTFQGKKSLVLSKESVVAVAKDGQCPISKWWDSLACQPPMPLTSALNVADNSIINIFGVVAFVSSETKEVNGQVRVVSSVHMASPTVRFQLRGWDLDPATLNRIEELRDSVVQVRRIRVTSFADNKIGEILDSARGTSFETFCDDALTLFWSE